MATRLPNGHANIELAGFRQSDLDTLSAIASVGKRHLYDGPLGECMLDHLRGLRLPRGRSTSGGA